MPSTKFTFCKEMYLKKKRFFWATRDQFFTIAVLNVFQSTDWAENFAEAL